MSEQYSECEKCGGKGFIRSAPVAPNRLPVCRGCDECLGSGVLQNYITLQRLEERLPDANGRLIRAAVDVARAQRAKGIAKYGVPLEDQVGYTTVGMIDMAAEELADGSVYVQKAREQVIALLGEIEKLVSDPFYSYEQRVADVLKLIQREKGSV